MVISWATNEDLAGALGPTPWDTMVFAWIGPATCGLGRRVQNASYLGEEDGSHC